MAKLIAHCRPPPHRRHPAHRCRRRRPPHRRASRPRPAPAHPQAWRNAAGGGSLFRFPPLPNPLLVVGLRGAGQGLLLHGLALPGAAELLRGGGAAARPPSPPTTLQRPPVSAGASLPARSRARAARSPAGRACAAPLPRRSGGRQGWGRAAAAGVGGVHRGGRGGCARVCVRVHACV